MSTVAMQQNVDLFHTPYSQIGQFQDSCIRVPKFGRRSATQRKSSLEDNNTTILNWSLPLKPSQINNSNQLSQNQVQNNQTESNFNSSLQSLKRRLSAKNSSQMIKISQVVETPRENTLTDQDIAPESIYIDKDVRAARMARLKKTISNRKLNTQQSQEQQEYNNISQNDYLNSSYVKINSSQNSKEALNRKNSLVTFQVKDNQYFSNQEETFQEEADDFENLKHSQELQACQTCNRTFHPDSLLRHQQICNKVFKQRRDMFDSSRTRILNNSNTIGTFDNYDLYQNFQKLKKRSPLKQGYNNNSNIKRDLDQKIVKSNIPKWKLESQSFRNSIRAAQGKPQIHFQYNFELGDFGNQQLLDDRVECSYCGRKFNADVAERHIPKCKETVAKPSRLKAKGGRGAFMRK